MKISARMTLTFIALCALSTGVVLTVLLAAAWWHSEIISEAACWRVGNKGVLIRTLPGRLHLVFARNCGWEEKCVADLANSNAADNDLWEFRVWPPAPLDGWRSGHFAIEVGEQFTGVSGTIDTTYLGVAAPFWTWMLLPGFPSVLFISLRSRRLRRIRSRQRLGLCQKCGYDLRASRERCPECGHRIEPPIATRFGFRRKTPAAQT
jgi:rRNA maturation protein Nop10